jgi:ABC-type antimicrobial peptide transport system permease subunit
MTTVSIYNVVLSPRDPGMVNLMSSPDGAMGVSVDRVKILAGRLYDSKAPGQVMIDQRLASTEHLAPGSTLSLYGVPSAPSGAPEYNKAVTLTFRVTAIVVFDDEIVPTGTNNALPTALVSSPFTVTTAAANLSAGDEAGVRLQPGASQTAFTSAAEALAKRYAGTGNIIALPLSDQVNTAERAIRPEAVALAVFAGLAGLIALAVIGQLLSRQLALDAAEFPVLRALGVQRAALVTLSLARLGIVTVTGAIVAIAVTIAASPLMPIGPARLAEPDPGLSVNGPVLAFGFAGICVLLLARVVATAWRQAAVRPAAAGSAVEPAGPRRGTRLAARLAAAGAPLAAVTGVRLALDPGHGRASVSVRSALLGLAVAVAAVAVAVTFGANLLRLVDTPRLYGQDWDVAIEGQFDTTMTADYFTRTSGLVAGISGVTFGVHGTVSIGGTVIPAIGLAGWTGPVMSSTVLSGRPPARPDEIALGALVLRRLGLHLGQPVTVTTPGGRLRMRITGSAVFPYFGQGSFTPTDAGQGAEVTADVLAPQSNAAEKDAGYNFALVKFAPGPARQADMAAFQRAWEPFCASIGQTTCLVTDQRPNTVNNYAAIDATPAVLAAVLALLGLGVLAQFTVSAARRSRREYAILKVLGLARRDLRSIAFWQAGTVAIAALAVGVPLGIAAGRVAWQLFAGQAGLPPDTLTPLSVLWMIPATAGAALLVAAPVARSVARLPASVALRTE